MRARLPRSRVALALWICAVLTFASPSPQAHPHDEPEIFDIKGTLTRVDVVNRAIELDTIDPTSRTRRNMLFFVDQKAKIRSGKARVDLATLQAGQRVTCTVERTFQQGREDRERLTVFEIRLDPVS